VALVIGIFQLPDHRRLRSDLLRKFPLTQPRGHADVVPLLGDLCVDALLFEEVQDLGLPLEVAAIQDFHGVRSRLVIPGHWSFLLLTHDGLHRSFQQERRNLHRVGLHLLGELLELLERLR
jgi:hypothetical protein